MTVLFSDPQPEAAPSLAYKLDLQGNIRWKTMSSGIKLTYDDNDADRIEVWVAEPKRIAIIEQETDYKITSKWVLA